MKLLNYHDLLLIWLLQTYISCWPFNASPDSVTHSFSMQCYKEAPHVVHTTIRFMTAIIWKFFRFLYCKAPPLQNTLYFTLYDRVIVFRKIKTGNSLVLSFNFSSLLKCDWCHAMEEWQSRILNLSVNGQRKIIARSYSHFQSWSVCSHPLAWRLNCLKCCTPTSVQHSWLGSPFLDPNYLPSSTLHFAPLK